MRPRMRLITGGKALDGRALQGLLQESGRAAYGLRVFFVCSERKANYKDSGYAGGMALAGSVLAGGSAEAGG